jgi:hypothetical protein
MLNIKNRGKYLIILGLLSFIIQIIIINYLRDLDKPTSLSILFTFISYLVFPIFGWILIIYGIADIRGKTKLYTIDILGIILGYIISLIIIINIL